MKKKDLIASLCDFDDNDHIMLGENARPYVPEVTRICGNSERYTAHYCVLKPGHSGDCYSACKGVEFEPDIFANANVELPRK